MTAIPRQGNTTCERCGRALPDTVYELWSVNRRVPYCLRCAMRFRPMLRRSLVVCLIVGTLLTAINQGNFILSGDFQAAMVWKIPMTYAVPFIVATIGGLLNARAGLSTSDALSA